MINVIFVTNLVIISISIFLICKLFYLYIFDGADSRTPYLIYQFIVYILFLTLFSRFLIVKSINSFISYLFIFLYALIMVAATKSQITNSKHNKFSLRYLLYNFYCIAFSIIIVISCIKSNFIDVSFNEIGAYQIMSIFIYHINFLSLNTILLLILLISISTIIDIVISIVSKKMINIWDIANFYSIIFLTGIYNFDSLNLNVYIIVTASILYLIIPFLRLLSISYDILKLAKGYNQRVMETVDNIRLVIKRKKNIQYSKRLLNFLEEDKETKELSLSLLKKDEIKKLDKISKELI